MATNMQALGMIETRGLVGSIEAADAMVKAALADRCTADNPRTAQPEQVKELYKNWCNSQHSAALGNRDISPRFPSAAHFCFWADICIPVGGERLLLEKKASSPRLAAVTGQICPQHLWQNQKQFYSTVFRLSTISTFFRRKWAAMLTITENSTVKPAASR